VINKSSCSSPGLPTPSSRPYWRRQKIREDTDTRHSHWGEEEEEEKEEEEQEQQGRTTLYRVDGSLGDPEMYGMRA
jgi:hypothetical protein